MQYQVKIQHFCPELGQALVMITNGNVKFVSIIAVFATHSASLDNRNICSASFGTVVLPAISFLTS